MSNLPFFTCCGGALLSLRLSQLFPMTFVGLPPELMRVQRDDEGSRRALPQEIPVRHPQVLLVNDLCSCGWIYRSVHVPAANASRSIGHAYDTALVASLAKVTITRLPASCAQEDRLCKLGADVTDVLSQALERQGEGLPDGLVHAVASLSQKDWDICLERHVDLRK